MSERPQLLLVGAGFSGREIARAAGVDADVIATRRDATGVAALDVPGVTGLEFAGQMTQALADALATCTHLITTVAPHRTEPFHDPVLASLTQAIEQQAPRLQWMGYLSTVGVYGNHDGEWVTEQTDCTTVQTRSRMRMAAEQAWRQLAASRDVPLAILRLSGIYGPGRNALEDALAGRARRLIKPAQVFNRIHVEDLATAMASAMTQRADGVFNISDDCPAPPQAVVEYAHQLVGRTPPPCQDFATADISEMARTFYAENKRVDNTKSKDVLGMRYQYPDYRAGLDALWASLRRDMRRS